MKARIGIVGGSGYAGGELIRLLLSHPDVEVVTVASRGSVGVPITAAHPGLLGFTDLVMDTLDDAALDRLAGTDAVFLCTPHGAARPIAVSLDQRGAKRIIDLSADHRLEPGWVYAQVDWATTELGDARRIAVPGCFATAVVLSLAPFVAKGLLSGPVHCVAATGSTGSGATPTATTHHPERFANLRAYKVLDHQHRAEVDTFLGRLGRFDGLVMVPLSAPMDRGILSTCFLPLLPEFDTTALLALLREAYSGSPLVRIREESPEVRLVRGTGLADLSATARDGHGVVLCAIDNLGKGAAFQAVQAMNLSLGFPRERALLLPPALP